MSKRDGRMSEQLHIGETEIKMLKNQRQNNERTIKHLNQYIEIKEDKIKALEEKINEFSTKHKSMANELRDRDETIAALREENKDISIRINSLEETINECTAKTKEVTLAYEEERKKCKALTVEMTKEIRDRDEEINKLKAEKNDLSSRYSQLASERLNHDLSESNRAMKLADRYSGIYNDIWVDTHEELQSLKMSDRSAIEYLLNGLLESYNYCEELAKCQLASLNNVLLHPLQSTNKPVNQGPRSTVAAKKYIMEVRRQMAAVNAEAVIQEFLSSMFRQARNEEEKKRVEACRTYYQKCAELSWLMVLHDPPLFLKADLIKGDKVDPNLYTVLSKGDMVAYLVWPPLLNGRQGGVLAKGAVEVVQFMTKRGRKK